MAVSLDIATSDSIRALHEVSPGARVFSSAFHQDGIRAYVAGHSGGLCWNVETGEILFRSDCGCFSVLFVGDFLVYDSGDALKMNELNQSCTGLEEDSTEFLGHSERVVDQCVTPDGTHLITCSGDATVRVFELQSAKCVYSFFNHRAQQYRSVAVHPKGNLVLAANRNSMVYFLEPHAYVS